VAGRNLHLHARCDGDHRSCPSIKAASAAFSVAVSTVPVISILTRRKLDLDRPAAGRPNWTGRRP
jgi:hypothetical protein